MSIEITCSLTIYGNENDVSDFHKDIKISDDEISLFGNCLKIYELYLNNTAQVGQ